MLRYIYCIAVFAFFAASRPASAAPADTAEVIKMVLHPMPATQPALSHSLLPRAIDQSPGNAATLYMIAAREVPTYSKEDLYKLDDLIDSGLADLHKKDKEAQQVLDRFSTSLHYVDLAARREEAHWDTGLRERGAWAMLPYLNDMRLLENVLCLQYRLQLSHGDFNGAEHSLQSALSMSRQLSDHPVLIQGLVQVGFVHLIMDHGIAEWVSQPGAPNLYWALTALPIPVVEHWPIAQWEQLGSIGSIVEVSRPLSSPSREQVIGAVKHALTAIEASKGVKQTQPVENQLSDLQQRNRERARQFLARHGFSKQAVQTMPDDQVVSLFFILQFRIFSDDVWKCIELPYWQVAPQLDQLDKAFKAEAREPAPNPLVLSIQNTPHIYYWFTELDWYVAQLRTIEAIRDYAAMHGGAAPAALDQITDLPLPIDPFTGKPFHYRLEEKKAVLECPVPPPLRRGRGRQYEMSFAESR